MITSQDTIYEITTGAQVEISIETTGVINGVSLRLKNRWEDEQIGNLRIWELLVSFRQPTQSVQQMLS